MQGIVYLMFLFCTGSMTGPQSLCQETNSTHYIMRDAIFLLPNEPLIPGKVYWYESQAAPQLHSPYQFTAHRMIRKINDDQDTYLFKGDSSNRTEIIQRQYIKLRDIR